MPKIQGFVFADKDGNGRWNNGDAGRQSAILLTDHTDKELKRFITKEKGEFFFNDLPTGIYRVRTSLGDGERVSTGETDYVEIKVDRDDVAVKLGVTRALLVKPPVVIEETPHVNPPARPDVTPNPVTPSGSIRKSVCGINFCRPSDIIHTSSGGVPASKLWKDARCTHSREWLTSNGRVQAGLNKTRFDGLRQWQAEGFGLTLVLATGDPAQWTIGMPTAAQSREAAKQLLDLAGDVVDSWEIGNEPNLNNSHSDQFYWIGSANQWVDLIGNPMAEIFQAAGKEVISASVTYDPSWVKNLFDAGLNADVIGFHPYRKTAGDLDALLSKLEVAVPGSKRIDLTEYNVFCGSEYLASYDPHNSRAAAHPLSADEIILRMSQSWQVLKRHTRVRNVSYFIANKKTPSATSPLMLVDNKMQTTKFFDGFFKTA